MNRLIECTMFRHAHGLGNDLRIDIPNLFNGEKYIQPFKDKYGEAMFEICFNNFIAPILEINVKNGNPSPMSENAHKVALEMKHKLDLFCATFVNTED